eukprot:GFYU01072756.1.p1 GENE.GFYU01072756.1~~GFYU01072756.1.p1  ORF type:complete len:136 (+),score=21.18 GFYU01072756.1:151-558(+)
MVRTGERVSVRSAPALGRPEYELRSNPQGYLWRCWFPPTPAGYKISLYMAVLFVTFWCIVVFMDRVGTVTVAADTVKGLTLLVVVALLGAGVMACVGSWGDYCGLTEWIVDTRDRLLSGTSQRDHDNAHSQPVAV